MIKGVHVKAGYRRAAAGVMGCLLVGGTLGATLKQGEAFPVTSGESPSAASRAALAWEPNLNVDPATLREQPMRALDTRLRRELQRDDSSLPALESYTVRPGDSVWSIAEEHNTDTGTLLALNGNVSPDALHPGQMLRVIRAFHGMTYAIANGDTLQSIAQAYRINADQIRLANNLDRGAVLQEGDLLFLPGAQPARQIRSTVASRGNVPRRDSAPAVAVATALSDEVVSVPVPSAPVDAPAPPAPKAAPSGGFIWPVSGGLHSSEYGPRWGGFHEGLDIAVPAGTVAVAAKGGTVAFAGWDGGYGYQVIIDHGDGVKTRYAHASALLVSVGSVVEQGEAIIKVGSTGNSTGPHLHFEIIVNGKPQNPRAYLP